MNALVEGGGDLIEIGVPFSDPMADGSVIQVACHEALTQGIDLNDILDIVKKFREGNKETPVVLMSYCNPVLAMGVEEFARAANKAGVDGVLLVDLPPEDGDKILETLKSNGIDTVLLVSPTTPDARCEQICKAASGFVYYVALKGVTGAKHLEIDDVKMRVARLKEMTDLPVAVGFGIDNAESASRIADIADGVVIGSAIVKRMADKENIMEGCRGIKDWLTSIRAAI